MKLHPILRGALYPFSLAYGAAAQSRIAAKRARAKRLRGVVISVGNLTVAGTGKTPFVLWLAESLHSRGKSIGILSRGYKGGGGDSQSTQPVREGGRAAISGDEPLMLSAHLMESVRIGVGPDRYSSGLVLERLGVEWFVLDDGFQHTQLARDVDIVLVDASVPFADEPLLPAGRRRERFSALARADLFVVTRTSSAPALESFIRGHSEAPLVYAQTRLRKIRPADSAAHPSPEWLAKKMFAFCGLGNPDAFYADLRRWGHGLAGHLSFSDHHQYSKSEIARIENLARAAGAEVLVCSEKDTFNLPGGASFSLPLYVCEIDMRPIDEGVFWSAFAVILARKRPEVKL